MDGCIKKQVMIEVLDRTYAVGRKQYLGSTFVTRTLSRYLDKVFKSPF